jgi:hypothetical protein
LAFPERKKEKLFSPESEKIVTGDLYRSAAFENFAFGMG